MGEDVDRTDFTKHDRTLYRAKSQRCVEVLARMLSDQKFDVSEPMIGLEIEFNLIGADHRPAMKNAEVLAAIGDGDFQTELGRFNIEINVAPRELRGRSLAGLEQDLRARLDESDRLASTVGARIAMIGILPTLTVEDLNGAAMSVEPRYAALNDEIVTARGEGLTIDIAGEDELSVYAETIIAEAACTSVQFHLQMSPQSYPNYWNAAGCVAGVQLALGANSPFLFGKQLWHETRIPLFEQAADTRPAELKAQGVRPRVWFGERWIDSILDQFEENTTYFPALLPIRDAEDPMAVYERGGTPQLRELRMHNGTIYRWNRPVYDVARDMPHVRLENRVLPAGPTVVDVLANGAFYYGLVHGLATADDPLWRRLSFDAARQNFYAAARDGIAARLSWPGLGESPATELALTTLLPLADRGLADLGVDTAIRERLLGVIEQRCLRRVNGAQWQLLSFEHALAGGRVGRAEALRLMLERYVELMHSNQPVHSWPIG